MNVTVQYGNQEKRYHENEGENFLELTEKERTKSLVTFLKLKETKELIILPFRIMEYTASLLNGEIGLIIDKRKKVAFVLDKGSKKLFIESHGEKFEINEYSSLIGNTEFWDKGIFPNFECAPGKHLLTKFVKRVFKASGIIYRNAEEFNTPQDFLQALLLVQNPYLQNFSVGRYKNIPNKNELEGYSSEIEIWNEFIGHKSKLLRNKAKENMTLFNIFTKVGKCFKNPQNLLYYAESIESDLKKTNYAFEELKTLDEEEILFNEKICIGLELLLSLDSEREMVKKVLRFEIQNTEVSFTSKIRFIGDIGNLYQKIKEYNPEYEATFDGNIDRFHNQLMADEMKIDKVDASIPYTGEERELDQIIGNYHFQLAESIFSLIDTGSTMNICVGGYSDSAYKKERTIVIVKDIKNDKPIACIDLQENRIVEAKLSHNRLPHGEIKELIIHWAEEHNIQWNCGDLLNENIA